MDNSSIKNSTFMSAMSSSEDSITGHSMHHSLSTPAGVDGAARTPPSTPKKGGKMLAIRVQMLDDTITMFQVQAKALGSVLFEQVCKQLHLLEADYFGLEYLDTNGTKYWLDLQKPISRQLGLSLVDPLLYFCVKFYTPDPAQLEEEYTRYLFCLQIKRDLSQAYMQCNENTSALMASYIVQAECGDFVPEDYPDHTYLSSYKFVPQQDHEMEKKIMENHKKHTGQSPAEADLNLLETARRCELYGMKMHPGKDLDNVPINLAVAHMGILVFQNYTKITTFSWAKIRKISFKRKKFLIKLHPEGYGFHKDTVEFYFEGRNECKNFWKKCVENHGFFRCSSIKNLPRHKTRVLSRGSSFRYSGKTQKQMVEFVRDNYVKRQTFQRSHSFRHSSAHSSHSNMHTNTVGTSISAHPLLPLAGSNLSVEASKLSASLGSMSKDLPVSPTMKSVCRPLGTATSWTSVTTEPIIINNTRSTKTTSQTNSVMVLRPPVAVPMMMNLHSPTETTQSDVSSATTSILGSPEHHTNNNNNNSKDTFCTTTTTTTTATVNNNPRSVSPPHAVHVAVHRADTGTIIHTHTTTRTHSNNINKSEGSLEHQHPHSTSDNLNNISSHQTVTQSQINLEHHPHPHSTFDRYSPPKRMKFWQRSASCRDLYDFSFEETGKAKQHHRRAKPLSKFFDKTTTTALSFDSNERSKQDSPITVYDDHHALYSADSSRDSNLEIEQDFMIANATIYSSSFPGTNSVFSHESSIEDPGNYDLRDSQEDLSHDSYELIEKSDDNNSTGSGDLKPNNNNNIKRCFINNNIRSCSLDSGNYLPYSDSESSERGIRQKFKSISDHDLFLLEDPRDLPREIIPRKSDGSFYKYFRNNSSRTSSQESKSDYYEFKNATTKSSKENLKRSRISGVGSRTSSQDSNQSLRKNRSVEDHLEKNSYDSSRASSFESKSEYFDASTGDKSFMQKTDYDRKINFTRNYGTQIMHSSPNYLEETEQSIRVDKILLDIEQNTFPIAEKLPTVSPPTKTTHIWPETIVGLSTEVEHIHHNSTTESEGNIFSFDEDRIQSLQESSDFSDHGGGGGGFGVVPNIDLKPKKDVRSYREVFMEIEPRICHDFPFHQPIERTKSDPNTLSRQKFNPNSRRLLLMHQKSIDLTPAESSDEDYLYKQIPSAPPITKFKGTHFEMPTAEFGHFDILKREVQGQKTKFEVPKSQFEILGVKNQADLVNPPPKAEEIPYVLHKRHVMNGTAKIEETKPEIILPAKEETTFLFTQNIDLSKVNPITLEVDKSKPVMQLLSSPKRDITHIDPLVMEALSSKLSQIESDSPSSSRTESLKPIQRILKPELLRPKIEEKAIQSTNKSEEKKLTTEIIKPKIICDKIKTDIIIKPKRVIKARMQPGKKGGKGNKTKVRITSFSSDDESLDSDDVFGSAEATPTRMEFSPPQMRKEMESILKYESERKYLQYTMSSTEVEGSPPTARKRTDKDMNGLNPDTQQTELRRISERSLSIPSSEDEFNVKTADLTPAFMMMTTQESSSSHQLKTVEETDKEDGDKSLDETLKEDLITENDLVTTIDYDREKEKALLRAEIESDIKNLKVPSRTKITEITSPSLTNKGTNNFTFAHARLNLSEGSAFTLLQKQQTLLDSPLSSRRARSLDAPIISVNKLPPLNAFSSKDDTVDEEETDQTNQTDRESSAISASDVEETTKTFGNGIVPETPPKKQNSIGDNDQIVPDLIDVKKKLSLGYSIKSSAIKPKLPPKGLIPLKPSKETVQHKKPQLVIQKSKPALKTAKTPSDSNNASKPPLGPKSNSTESKKSSKALKHQLLAEKARSADAESKSDDDRQKSLSNQSSLTLPEIKRTKSQEMEPSRRTVPKEKARSLEKLELRRMSSKDRAKSQEESEESVAERRKLQQMLYETAVKQTKNLKSPVKDVLPVFPQVEETVRERGGRLEISIKTIETNVSLEEAIIVTKSPKRLDKKLTKSLEINLDGDDDNNEKGMQRMGKSLDLERSKSEDDDKSRKLEIKPESCSNQEIVIADIHAEPFVEEDQKVILEGTSLDVWFAVKKPTEKLKNIEIIQKGDDFFEQGTPSSDLANSDTEMQKASATVGKFIRKKLQSRRKKDAEDSPTIIPADHDDEESLTEVSELKPENDLLTVTGSTLIDHHKNALLKLNVERSKSDENNTGSWMTVECEEYVGTETSFEESPGQNEALLQADTRQKLKLLKRSSDQSKSSDTGSWTSGEKELSPGNNNKKETDESSVSCSMGRAIGLSQTIETFATREQITEKGGGISHSSEDAPKSPRSPRICILGRAFTIDEGSQKLDDGESSSDNEAINDIPKDLATIEEVTKKPYPFEEKWSQDSELGQKLQRKLAKKLSSSEKGSMSSVDESLNNSYRRNTLEKPNLLAVEKLSTESRNSLDTESSSGSFGVAVRTQKSGDIPIGLSSTWKAFPLDSSGSESFDDNNQLLSSDQEYFLYKGVDTGDFTSATDLYKPDDDAITPTKDGTELPEDLANFSSNFYPCLTSTDILGTYGGGGGGTYLSRTLSRISERSTNSEKSSLEEDSTKATTHSDSLINDDEEESMGSSNQISVSTESPSNVHLNEENKKTPTNEKPSISGENNKPTDPTVLSNFSSLLQRQISDDRRTSAEMAELSMDDIEIITSDRGGLRLKRQGSDDTIIDEECFDEIQKIEKLESSQESEDWPLPEIPSSHQTNQNNKSLLAMHEVPSSDTSVQLTTQVYQLPKKNIPKTFGLRSSLKSQESEQWPSPPSSLQEPIILVENIETYYISPAEEPFRVTVESKSSTCENDSNSEEYKNLDLDMEKTHIYENIVGIEHISESLSDSQSVSFGAGPLIISGIKIVLEEKTNESNSDEDLNISNLNDDVFLESNITVQQQQLRPPTALRRSTASDDSRRSSHSSYSEEDGTSSMGTNLEDGTVRFALKPTKCTHSSHSEDTSIALSLSEWSNSTNTVKFQNLSSSGTTKSSSAGGLKSDENSLTDIAQSISEWSSTQSSTLKAQQHQQLQKLSSISTTTSTTGGETTLTGEKVPSISEWSNTNTNNNNVVILTTKRLGSSVDIEDFVQPDQQRSPKNIPSEDFSIFTAAKTSAATTLKSSEPKLLFTKSTERPIIIPSIQSDTDKSSSSVEHMKTTTPSTVHIQRYDKEIKGYDPKKYPTSSHHTKSTDRPVKVNLKLAKCSPYYSSSLSSESTPLTGSSPVPMSKTATVPLTRIHKRPVSRNLTHTKSPPSENDSTSSVESPKSKSERERRGYRRKRQQLQQQRNKTKIDKEPVTVSSHCSIDEYFYVEHEHGLTEYNEYIRERNMEEMASNFQYESGLAQENLLEETGYYPDVDSQSGSDIFRMEREEPSSSTVEEKHDFHVETFDVNSIPPPLLEDDFENDSSNNIAQI